MPLMPHEQSTPFDSSVKYDSIWYAMIEHNDLTYCSRNWRRPSCLHFISELACHARGWCLFLDYPVT